MIGTLDYMSPEQMVGGEMTPASDIYTLGVVIYELITGRTPFPTAQTPTALLAAVLTQTPDPLSRHADVPGALDPILARCLERDPQRRYTEVGALAEALGEVAAESQRSASASAARPKSDARPTSAPLPRLAPVDLEEVTPSNEPTRVVAPLHVQDAARTGEATRIDVRVSGSSQPVLDARGPRIRPGALAGASPQVWPAESVIHAKGSHHEIDAGGPKPMLDGRGSQPMIDVAAWRRREPSTAPPPGPAPYGYLQPSRPPHSDALARAAARTQLLRRALFWVLLFLASMAITLIVTR
jgi:serine/threonine protein kinase